MPRSGLVSNTMIIGEAFNAGLPLEDLQHQYNCTMGTILKHIRLFCLRYHHRLNSSYFDADHTLPYFKKKHLSSVYYWVERLDFFRMPEKRKKIIYEHLCGEVTYHAISLYLLIIEAKIKDLLY
jgi:hypothetical protein